MTVTEQILTGMSNGRETFRNIMPDASEEAPVYKSELALGDNVEYMRNLLREGYAGKFSLIYIDPPFFTRSKFNAAVTLRDASGAKHRIRHLAFDDRFERSLEYYIENMTLRLLLMRELLSDDGLMWIHLDWHSSHYVRIVLDDIMGSKNFVNEIVWCYKSGGSGKKHFSRKHDTILVYSKTGKYNISIPEEKSYNRGFKPYNFKGVKEYRDEQGWYTLVNMKDVWTVDMVGRTSAERNGYATQKPLSLMDRIIRAGSREGDLVGDFFCGSGSFLESAEASGRKWMGCDNEKLAVSLARKRLNARSAEFSTRYLDDVSSETGRADITVLSSEELENGRRLVRCAVTGFIPEIETGYIQMNDRVYVQEALDNDPLQFIDYIMIEDESRPRRQMIDSGFDDMTLMIGHDAKAVVVDIFGREYRAEIWKKEKKEL